MTRWFALYRASLYSSVVNQFQYRWAMAIWFLWNVVGPVVNVTVWNSVAAAKGGTVGEYDAGALGGYFLVMMVANHLTDSWIHWEFEARVRGGSFSPLLLKPVHPIHFDIMENLAFRIVTLGALIPAVIFFILVFHPVVPAPWWAWIVVWPILALTFVIRFLMSWTIGLSSFWITRTEAIGSVYEWVAMFLSGRIAPLALLPAWMRVVTAVTPFAVTIPLPVNVMMGNMSLMDTLHGLAWQAAWVGILWAGFSVIWKRAITRYGAVGA